MVGGNGELPRLPREVDVGGVQTPQKVLLQITIDAQSRLSLNSALDKEALVNLLIDATKLVVNTKQQEKSSIIAPR